MANMYTQIGQNLYADDLGKYYNLNNGNYANISSPFDTQSQKINQLYDSQKTNQLDQLRQQRDKAVTGFNQQKTDLAPQYQNQRNQADVVNAQNVQKLRELMAAQGINASGENLTTQAQMASARQDSFRDINNNESLAIRGIDQQIADWNDPSREQSIVNAIEAERSGKLSDAFQQAQAQIYQQQVDWRNYQMEQERLALEKRMKELEMQRMQQQMAAQAAARKQAVQKTTTTQTIAPKTIASVNSFNQAKAPTTPLDIYYSQPGIIAGQMTGSKYLSNPVPPARNPNLTAWEKMKMLSM